MTDAPELIPTALKMFSALAIVLGGLWVTLALVRRAFRRASGGGGERLVRVIASHPLGIKKSLALVEVPGAVLVLGVTGERIELLSRIEDPELLARCTRKTPEPAVSFYEHLKSLTARLQGSSHA